MSRIAYNAGVLLALAMIIAGCAMLWGAGVALLAGGCLVLALTMAGAILASRRT